MEKKIEFKNSTEMNQYYRAMMSQEARDEEDFVKWFGVLALAVVSFVVLLVLSLGIVFLGTVFLI